MNKVQLHNIESFLGSKEKCVFCQSNLEAVFMTLTGKPGRSPISIPLSASYLKDKQFSFNIKYTSAVAYIEAEAEIDIATNTVKLYVPNKLNPDPLVIDYGIAQQAFNWMAPHVELFCPNKTCKMKYCIYSNNFVCYSSASNEIFYIPEVNISMESFVVDKFWIVNDWHQEMAQIYTKADSVNQEPIQTNMFDLDSTSKEKVINRVKTLVTFS